MSLWHTNWCSLSLCAALMLSSAAGHAIQLEMPIACEVGRTCFIQNYVDHDPSSSGRDYQCGTLTYDGHNGTDFRLLSTATQRAGVHVLAVTNGEVLRVRDGVEDSLVTSAQVPKMDQACGNGIVLSHADGWETQYCHLARGSVLVKPGDHVVTGQRVGSVGLSGLSQFPHLHLTVRHRGKVIDPFAFGTPEGACGGGTSLWSPKAQVGLAYRARVVLNAGFAQGSVTAEQIESGELGRGAPATDAPALVAYVRSIGLRAGDEQTLLMKGPDGQVLAGRKDNPLERSKAQYMLYVGKKRPETGWQAGTYQASYVVVSAGMIVLEQTLTLNLGRAP